MAETFDPYHKWLGIPSKEQPPNHYRLLGIRPFEDDPDVIESAADQRMGHLRTLQTGKHGKLSQRLLNEVAAAKVCLLRPDKRAAYDQRLRENLLAETERRTQTLPKVQLVEPAQETATPGEVIPSIVASAASHRPARKKVPWQTGVGGRPVSGGRSDLRPLCLFAKSRSSNPAPARRGTGVRLAARRP